MLAKLASPKNTCEKHGQKNNTKNTLLKYVGPTSNTENTLVKQVSKNSNTKNTLLKHVGPTSNTENTLSKRGGGQTQPALYLITLTGGSLQVEKCGIPLGQFFSHKICVMLVVKLLFFRCLVPELILYISIFVRQDQIGLDRSAK